MSASALTLASIVRRHAGSTHAAVDLSLDVRAGELLAILGASGAGKTTTLRIVAGYEAPDGGRVLLDGADVTDVPPERRGIGMVFQHYALFPHLSVDENVAFGLAARGVSRTARRERARQALAALGLDGTGARAIHALSGGEQQRVALARALVIEPRVVLLDEPLSNLDPTLRVAMRDELRETLRRAHVTALFVTHDQDDAFAIADRVALLDRGRLLQVGPPETLYDRPATRAVADFIGRATLVPARRDGDAAIVTIGGVARRVPAVADHADAPGWLAVLRPEALTLDATEADDVWPGRVVACRFAAGATICRVALAADVVVEVVSRDRSLREGDGVGVRASGVIALVPAEGR
jgi:putative spermidine/putrescine transport system ATP-binding protein